MSEQVKTYLLLSAVAVLAAAGGYCAWQTPTGQDLIKSLLGMVGMFFTPFLLESTVALMGILGLFAYLRHRAKEDGDGWVEIEVNVADDTEVKREEE